MTQAQENIRATFMENRTAIVVTVACLIFIGFVLIWPNLFKTSEQAKTLKVPAPVMEEESVEPEIANPDMDSLRIKTQMPPIQLPETPETPDATALRRGMPTEQHMQAGGLNPRRFVTSGYFVQVGAFKSQGHADDLAQRLEISGWNTRIEMKEGGTYAVWVGPHTTRDAAEADMAKLDKSMGLKGFIVQLK